MHTSGLIVEGTSLAGDSRDAFVRDVRQPPRESAPGEKYRYSNAGFSLLAAIVEAASGETYEAYLRSHVFTPAGMRTVVFRDEVPAGDPLFAHGYVGRRDAISRVRVPSSCAPVAGTCMLSTIHWRSRPT